jgi:hypothetical protein
MERQGAPRAEHGIGPFVTWVHSRSGGAHRLQTSRRLRKGLQPVPAGPETRSPDLAGTGPHDWLRLWMPARLGWWIAVLFIIGSALFALGGMRAAAPDLPELGWIGASAVNPVFFVGSLFFTAAAYLQFYEALNGDITAPNAPRRYFGWRPRNLGFLASAVQLVGTLLFNRSTGDALLSGLGWWMQDMLIWKPDMTGCLCFLVASQLAIMEFAHGWFAFRPGRLEWWIVTVNMLGSIFFLVSGVASFVIPSGAVIAPLPASAGTVAGALCFLLGAYLLIPEQAEPEPPRRAAQRSGKEEGHA